MKYLIEGTSKRNTRPYYKPNEDYFLYDSDNGNIVLLDGVSRDKENGIYPNPSPAYDISKIIAEYYIGNMNKIIENNKEGLIDESVLKKVIKEANEETKNYNGILNHEFPAGAVGIFLSITDNVLYYAYIGDCTGMLIRNSKKIPFTSKQTLKVSLNKKELTTKQIRYEICNNAMHPYGYGVLDGNPNALDFVITGRIVLYKNDVIILHSDGLDSVIDNLECDILIYKNLSELVSYNIESNNDDRTIVRIRMV